MVKMMEKLNGKMPATEEECAMFRDIELLGALTHAINANTILEIDMDGAPYGYTSLFMREVFGGLAYFHGSVNTSKHIKIHSKDEPMLHDEAMYYINKESKKGILQ